MRSCALSMDFHFSLVSSIPGNETVCLVVRNNYIFKYLQLNPVYKYGASEKVDLKARSFARSSCALTSHLEKKKRHEHV